MHYNCINLEVRLAFQDPQLEEVATFAKAEHLLEGGPELSFEPLLKGGDVRGVQLETG
jgi:hypothetical protein